MTFTRPAISTFVIEMIGEMALTRPIQTREHKVLRLAFGVEIGFYRHENVTMQNNNQHVWILHLEITSVERPDN